MSPWHWLIVIAIALLLFGAKRLPDAARSLGRSARILKAELHDEPRADTTPSDSGSETGSERPAEHGRRVDDPTGT